MFKKDPRPTKIFERKKERERERERYDDVVTKQFILDSSFQRGIIINISSSFVSD